MSEEQLQGIRSLIRMEIATSLSKFVGNANNAAYNAELAQEIFDGLLSGIEPPTTNPKQDKET